MAGRIYYPSLYDVHGVAKQPFFCSLFAFYFIALLTAKRRERHAKLPADIARE